MRVPPPGWLSISNPPHPIKAQHLGLQRLAAGECQQPRGQPSAAFHRAQRTGGQPLQPRVIFPAFGDEVQIAGNDGQQVVEIMRHAARELADRLHLLRLVELRLALAQRLGRRAVLRRRGQREDGRKKAPQQDRSEYGDESGRGFD